VLNLSLIRRKQVAEKAQREKTNENKRIINYGRTMKLTKLL